MRRQRHRDGRSDRVARSARPTDLGFGIQSIASQRMLLRDGEFNIERRGFGLFGALHAYHTLLTLPWKWFTALAAGFYVVCNVVFAGIYLALGPGTLLSTGDGIPTAALRAFFFSVETISTIGYGNIVPVGVPANIVMTVESFLGIVLFALVTGLVFARFARPVAKVLYSEKAIIAPYGDGEAFEFRIVNGRSNQLIDMRAQVFYSRVVERDGVRQRVFDELKLERRRIAFFALSWTIVHPLDEDSPLWGVTPESLFEGDAEFLVLLSAVDETFHQQVYSRSSYKANEVLFGARFERMFELGDEGRPVIHRDRLSAVEKVARPAVVATSATAERSATDG